MRRTIVGLFLLAVSVRAHGQDDPFGDDDDELIFDDEPSEPTPKPATPTPTPTPPAAPAPSDEPEPAEPADEEEALDFEDETEAPGEEIRLDDERRKIEPQAPGADTSQLYRRQLAAVEGIPGDEEVMAWEAYLDTYPNSLFRPQIEQRIDELLAAQYHGTQRVQTTTTIDARDQELVFVQPLHLPNLNPRSRVNVNLEIGFGARSLYTGGQADFEWAFFRNLSVHGGVDGNYNGWGLDAGVRYAFVKSAKHKLVATIMADARMNLSGTPFFQARPVIGIAKMFGPAQILMSFGADIGTRAQETVALRGGLHVAVRLAPPVGVFVESDFYLRNLGHETLAGTSSPYAFDVVTVGLRFYPKIKTRQDPDPLELAAGGQVGVAANYVQPYLGAVSLQGTYYLKHRDGAP